MFVIRDVETKDIDGLLSLAKTANFLTLPNDRALLTRKIARSIASFRGKHKDFKEDGEYIFVLEDLETKKIIGTSMVIAQHGTPDEPHTYFQVMEKKKISKSLHHGFLHKVLRLAFDFDGPTELGGLVLLPEYRSHEAKLGRFLSFVRFLYIAARKPYFQDEILVELMPPFNERGESPLWEEIGRKFTNMSYMEADRLSRKNREFITSLFPEGDIYTCMLSSEARQAIGEVHPDTQPVKRMLEKLGFKYRNQIDPFDGGPHYWAKTAQVGPIKNTKRVKPILNGKHGDDLCLVMSITPQGSVRAIQTECALEKKAKLPTLKLSRDQVKGLGFEKTQEVYVYDLT